MDPTPRDNLVKAARRYRTAEKALDAARAELADAIVSARLGGVTPTELAEITPYKREHVRRVLREAGIGPDGTRAAD